MYDIEIQKLYPDVKTPTIESEYSTGADIYAYITGQELNNGMVLPPNSINPNTNSSVKILPHTTIAIHTGLRARPPEGFDIKLYPRSGLAYKLCLTLSNAVGVIDYDYDGEIQVLLHNNSDTPVTVSHGDRIAQLALERVYSFKFNEVSRLTPVISSRGEGGLGSTGV